LFLSSFSKYFFGGFMGFQWVTVRKFAFLVSPNFLAPAGRGIEEIAPVPASRGDASPL
jgi:hypothetical protein